MRNKVLEPLEDMFFTDVKDLYENITYIQERFSSLERDYQELYKWYFFYQLCLLKDTKHNPIKSNLWSYICGVLPFYEVVMSYSIYKKSIKNI